MSQPALISPTADVVTIARLRKNIVVALGKVATRVNCHCGAEVYVLESRWGRPLIVDDEMGVHVCREAKL